MNANNASWLGSLPASIDIREVGPRDGLQSEEPVPTAQKIELINRLSQTGVRRIEAVSFVHPRAIPAMADASQVWEGIKRHDDVVYSALVPNLTGAQRAVDAGFTDIEIVVSASSVHNEKNLARPLEDSLAALGDVADAVHGGGGTLEVIIATSFGCPYVGDVEPTHVASVCERSLAAGADQLAFGDTTGMATPRRVAELIEAVRSVSGDTELAMHFHNTRGTALANVLVALSYGITQYDASVGGLGGCPYAPGASGNLATEELVHMAADMGLATGIDLPELLDVARYAQTLVSRDLPSAVLKAGPRTQLTTY